MEYKLFQIIVAAFVKTITLRPKMNRFIKGYRVYQRDALTAAFVVKNSLLMTAVRRWLILLLTKMPIWRLCGRRFVISFTSAGVMNWIILHREWIL